MRKAHKLQFIPLLGARKFVSASSSYDRRGTVQSAALETSWISGAACCNHAPSTPIKQDNLSLGVVSGAQFKISIATPVHSLGSPAGCWFHAAALLPFAASEPAGGLGNVSAVPRALQHSWATVLIHRLSCSLLGGSALHRQCCRCGTGSALMKDVRADFKARSGSHSSCI